MNRLKAAIICTLSMIKKDIIIFALLEAAVTLIMIWGKNGGQNVYSGNGIPAIIFLFLFGISFYRRHTAFCVSNSVSAKYRAVSALVCAGGLCLIAAVYNCTAPRIIFPAAVLSEAELLRIYIRAKIITRSPFIISAFETFFFYISVFSAGYFFGGLEYSKSRKAMTGIMAAVSAALLFFAVLGRLTFIDPAAWIFAIPAMLFRTRLTAVAAYILISAALLFFGYKFSMTVREQKTEEET